MVLKTDDPWSGISAADLTYVFLTYAMYFTAFDHQHYSVLFVMLGSGFPSILSTSYAVTYIFVVSLTGVSQSN